MIPRKCVLIVGEQPELVDFSDPAVPPGMDAHKVRTDLQHALTQLRTAGYDADVVLVTTAGDAPREIAAALHGRRVDCVVVGAGLRVIPKMTAHFEAVMNALREHAPAAKLAFNTSPVDSAAAAERQLA